MIIEACGIINRKPNTYTQITELFRKVYSVLKPLLIIDMINIISLSI